MAKGYACMHVHTHACMHARMHACTHARTHTHTHTHTHTQSCNITIFPFLEIVCYLILANKSTVYTKYSHIGTVTVNHTKCAIRNIVCTTHMGIYLNIIVPSDNGHPVQVIEESHTRNKFTGERKTWSHAHLTKNINFVKIAN